MKPAHLLPVPMLALLSGLTGAAFAQTPVAPGPPDAEPTAVAPAPPPAPAEPPGADLPPPPPPRAVAPPAPQGTVQISAPPVPALVPRRGYHVHDGFYLRMAAGLGGGRAGVSTNRESAKNFGVGGAGLALNLWLGGTPWSGVAIGGLLSLHGISDSQTTIEGRESSEPMAGGLVMIGMFIDAFPDPQRGLHFGGALGLARVAMNAERNALADRGVKDYDGGGLGLSAWIGYMGWVGPEWSLGGMLQLTGVATRQEEGNLTREGAAGVVSLSLTAAYH